MSVPRRARFVLILAGLVLFAAAPSAQFPKLRVPKPPSIPGVKPPGHGPSGPCEGVTEDDVNRLDKGVTAERETRERMTRDAEAKQASLKAAQDRRNSSTAQDVMKTMMCTSDAQDKDTRQKEADRLHDLADQASEKGDEAQSRAYSRRANAISEAVAIDADRKCGGHGAADLYDCIHTELAGDARAAELDGMRRQAADAGRRGDHATENRILDQVDEIEGPTKAMVQMKCMVGGRGQLAAGAAPSEAERLEGEQAADQLRNATDAGRQAGYEAAGLEQRKYAVVRDCVAARLADPKGTPIDPQAGGAVDQHASNLRQGLGVP